MLLHRPKGEKSELNESAQKKKEGEKIYRELRKIHIEIQYSSPPPHIESRDQMMEKNSPMLFFVLFGVVAAAWRVVKHAWRRIAHTQDDTHI